LKELFVDSVSIRGVVCFPVAIGTKGYAVPNPVALCGTEDVMNIDETGVVSFFPATGSLANALASFDDFATNTGIALNTGNRVHFLGSVIRSELA
jgi:hypothetical protein